MTLFEQLNFWNQFISDFIFLLLPCPMIGPRSRNNRSELVNKSINLHYGKMVASFSTFFWTLLYSELNCLHTNIRCVYTILFVIIYKQLPANRHNAQQKKKTFLFAMIRPFSWHLIIVFMHFDGKCTSRIKNDDDQSFLQRDCNWNRSK